MLSNWYGFFSLKMSANAKKNWRTFFVTIFQVSADEGMGKWSKLVEFWTRKLFQIRACVISARKAKQLDATTMFTYSHANTPLGQTERAYYLSYFIRENRRSLKRLETCLSWEDFVKMPVTVCLQHFLASPNRPFSRWRYLTGTAKVLLFLLS